MALQNQRTTQRSIESSDLFFNTFGDVGQGPRPPLLRVLCRSQDWKVSRSRQNEEDSRYAKAWAGERGVNNIPVGLILELHPEYPGRLLFWGCCGVVDSSCLEQTNLQLRGELSWCIYILHSELRISPISYESAHHLICNNNTLWLNLYLMRTADESRVIKYLKAPRGTVPLLFTFVNRDTKKQEFKNL